VSIAYLVVAGVTGLPVVFLRMGRKRGNDECLKVGKKVAGIRGVGVEGDKMGEDGGRAGPGAGLEGGGFGHERCHMRIYARQRKIGKIFTGEGRD
jgi:hypothetical protein